MYVILVNRLPTDTALYPRKTETSTLRFSIYTRRCVQTTLQIMKAIQWCLLSSRLSIPYPLTPRDKWVPVTTAWRALRLRMEERPPIWRVATNKLNKQSRTADEGGSSSLGIWRGANNSSLLKRILLQNIHRQSLGPGLILWYDLSNEKGT